MFASKDTLLTRPSGYTIARSVRLRSSASGYFNRTVASGNRQIWTFSSWIKRGTLSTEQYVFQSSDAATGSARLSFNADNTLAFREDSGASTTCTTSSVFRDPSAWYHIIVAYDTTQATSANRIKFYINGVQQTLTGSFPAQNTNGYINYSSFPHRIAAYTGNSLYFDGYLTEINFIDGQALTPSSFGETDSITGVWKPKKYNGTYGTNGFYLNFSDNSASTAATIGKDYSGNGNNWTPNNISVTAGTTYDSMVDSPTVGSLSSNYAVLNPLDKSTRITLSNGNLTTAFDQTANHAIVRASMGMTTGKFYWEVTVSGQTGSAGAPVDIFGVQSAGSTADGVYVGSTGTGMGWGYNTTNVNFYASNFTTSGTPPVQINGTMSVAYDADNGLLWFASAGTYIQGNPSTGSSPSGTRTGTNVPMFPAVSFNNTTTGTWNFNFGQRPFTYTPPTGFVALNTYNLPASTIKNGAAYMAATLYTGNGSTQTVSNAVGSTSFQPDFVWIKDRNTARGSMLFDSVRGIYIRLRSNTTDAEQTETDTLTAFNSNGFNLSTNVAVNGSTETYVGWQWKAGTTSASNTNGSITSTVSAGATQGFSVVTYTGNGTSGATVGHGLGVSPSMIIGKIRSTTGDWYVWQTAMGDNVMRLNTTAAQIASTGNGVYNTASFTSSVFALGSGSSMNASGGTFVAYCFSAVAGYSAFGSYTGNGSTDGTFVYTGFRPRFVLIKISSGSTGSWYLLDSSRDTYNVASNTLFPDLSNAEGTGANFVDFLSNGFKLRNAGGSTNGSGYTFIYACFAENPFKNALAR